jgi:type I restriction enzyme S subunit
MIEKKEIKNCDLGKIPASWEIKNLGDVCDIKGRIGWRGYTTEDLSDSGPLVIGATQISRNNKLDLSKPTFISREKYEESPEIKIDQWDILIVKVGNTIGKVAIVRDDIGEACINPNTVLLKRIKADPRFLYYHLINTYAQHFLISNSVASAQPAINQTVLKEMLVPFPPLPVQQKIASILGALDDKIELNRRMNRTLEEIAQAIFRHWFMENPTSLPTELIPFSEIIKINPNRSLQKGQTSPYLEMSNMPIVGHRPLDWNERPYTSGMKFMNGDTLIARITPCLENGKTAYVDFLNENQVGWGSTEYIVFRPIDSITPEFGYFLARSTLVRDFAIQNMTGTSGRQRTPASCFNSLLIPKPNSISMRKFKSIVRNIFQLINNNDNQTRTLIKIRDLLIPQLIQGNYD